LYSTERQIIRDAFAEVPMSSLLLAALLACAPGWDRTTIGDRAGDPERGTRPDAAGDPLDGEASPSWVDLTSPTTCTDPCTFTASASDDVAAVAYVVEGWDLGSSSDSDFALTYDFSHLGDRSLELYALDAQGSLIAWAGADITVLEPTPDDDDTDCSAYTSSEQEYAPVQTTGSGLPGGATSLNWLYPADSTNTVAFAGTPGYAASHEGMDYVHGDSAVSSVPVYAATHGTVAYVRLGCPQSSTFSHNDDLRECGSGWGNHVVVDHGDGIVTRYAHLDPDGIDVRVGDAITTWTRLGWMGNSGRSELRHLHFELGTSAGLDPCAPAQSFERVYDPAGLL